MKTKVFCIGFHKTGTTSMAVALRQLGYRVTGPNGVRDPDIENNVISMAYDLAKDFDAFQDNPWPILYKELDAWFPGSKFILTLRTPESWIKSQVNHFGKKETPMRKWIYGAGCPEGNEDIYLMRFRQHYEEVLEYFKDRSNDLLVFDLPKGDGWEKLCSFLGIIDIPDNPFPHANNRESDKSLLYRKYKLLIGKTKNFLSRVKRYFFG